MHVTETGVVVIELTPVPRAIQNNQIIFVYLPRAVTKIRFVDSVMRKRNTSIIAHFRYYIKGRMTKQQR